MNDDMMRAIAKEYDAGRLLLIATTDLDDQQPVIWNIGAIAKSRHPRALDTIRRVLLASAAVPGAFPPTMIDVTVDGKPYQEMHVDGGAFNQVFLYPPSLLDQRRDRLRRKLPVVPAAAYIIRNGRLDPERDVGKRQTLSIISRAISTMISVSGFNDALTIYKIAQDDAIAFNLAYIGADFTEVSPEPFDPGFMRSLFQYGYERGKSGYQWLHTPPRVEEF
jgi:predicted acylesterase/phospholipase RssA